MDLRVIKRIKDEFCAGLGNVPAPLEEVESSDEVVGEVDDADTRMLLSLAKALDRAAAETTIKAQYEEIKEERERYIRKIKELRYKSQALNNLFWAAIKDDFCLWGSGTIGIRRGWKVVKVKNDDEFPSAEYFIKRMVGE